MNFQEAGTDTFLIDGTVEKVLSNTTWAFLRIDCSSRDFSGVGDSAVGTP